MSCTLTKGLKRVSCKLAGGIKMIYLVMASDDYWSPTVTNDEITSLSGNASNLLTLYEVENMIGQGFANESVVTNVEQATSYFSQEVMFAARGFDAERIKFFEQVSKGSFAVIVHYHSGISRVFGKDFFLDTTAGEDNSGSAVGDGNIFNITLSGMELEKARPIKGSTAALPLGDIVADEYTIVTG